jgi:hypothetical protein
MVMAMVHISIAWHLKRYKMNNNDFRLIDPVDWKTIYSLNGIFEAGCWESGCAAHCCNYERVGRNFKIIKRINEVPLFPGEYLYLKQNGKLQPGSMIKTIHFSLKNGVRIPVVLNWCPHNGRCPEHDYRPVMCRMYPYFPLVDLTGRVKALERSIPYDLFWERLGETLPCAIRSLSLDSINSFLQIVVYLCMDPHNIFYLMAAHIYKQQIEKGIRKSGLLKSPHSPDGFFANWEKLLLTNRLFDPDSTLNELTDLWVRLRKKYPDRFNLSELREDIDE